MSSSSKPLRPNAQERLGPGPVDRILVYQFDPSRPSLGGVDTCIRAIAKYQPDDSTIAFVGVDANVERRHELGKWQRVALASTAREVWFLPVARLDPDQRHRLLPHGLRLMMGLWRFRKRIPLSRAIQAHKLESAAFLRRLRPATPLVYFIHSQGGALAAKGSDSRWRLAGRLQSRLEHRLVATAASVVVFNDDYARELRAHNANVHAWPTWYDSELLAAAPARNIHEVLWVGRVEPPKDPLLAISVFERLCSADPLTPWTLTMVGDGSAMHALVERTNRLSDDLRSRVVLVGVLSPAETAVRMLGSGVLLMTSVPGYEGSPRVLVEGLAAGLPAVVTAGTDTGGLILEATNGFVCEREPDALARAIVDSSKLDRAAVRSSVATLDARHLVRELLAVTEQDIRSSPA